ncbi:Asp-tRNA(Asn)/Glu-tRNA(Gln) amidotransferase subunit GatA [Chloroflexota bacterium]
MDLRKLTIQEAHKLLINKKISSYELTLEYLARIKEIDPIINSYITISEEHALTIAKKADDRIARNLNVTPLTGIPYSLKDCFSTKKIRTTCGSKILEDYLPSYNATVVKILESHGSVLLGKQNMDEFGMGSSCENSAFFNTKNPWYLDRIPGGSSGGSAAGLSAGLSTFAIGEDTGGSIRMPAGFCNLVGLKPTYGLVSRYGHIALVSSFDCVGPMTKDVFDCAIVLEQIAGNDPLDGTSLKNEIPSYTKKLVSPVKGMRLGIPKEYYQLGMDIGVEKSIQEAIDVFREIGMEIVEISLPNTEAALPVYYLILFAEASANLARFDGIRFSGNPEKDFDSVMDMIIQTRNEGFGEEVKRRIMLGAYVLSAGYYDAYYLKAQKVRTLIQGDFNNAFKECDLLLAPINPSTAFKIGEKVDDPLQMYLSDIFVVAANPAGVPALALPCGFYNDLPVGMQLIGNHSSEEILLRAGYAYQQETDWHKRQPSI